MSWLTLRLETNKDRVEPVAQALEDCGALAVTLEAADSQTQLEVELNTVSLWPRNRITGLFPADADVSAIVQRIERQAGAALAFDVEVVPDRDWQTAWREKAKPLRFGSHLWVCPSGCAPPQPDAVKVVMDPGLAFGSGSHPSTQLCLAWLADHPFKGEDVIDYGCGSGILAIAALKLGARRAWGVDTDPRALAVSERNAAQNGVAERYQALAPETLSARASADIVLANILARPLIELAPRLMSLLKPGGRLVLAGLLAEQLDIVRAPYAHKLALQPRFRRDETSGQQWVMLVGADSRHPD